MWHCKSSRSHNLAMLCHAYCTHCSRKEADPPAPHVPAPQQRGSTAGGFLIPACACVLSSMLTLGCRTWRGADCSPRHQTSFGWLHLAATPRGSLPLKSRYVLSQFKCVGVTNASHAPLHPLQGTRQVHGSTHRPCPLDQGFTRLASHWVPDVVLFWGAV